MNASIATFILAGWTRQVSMTVLVAHMTAKKDSFAKLFAQVVTFTL